MKNQRITIFGLLIFIGMSVFAQKKVTQAEIDEKRNASNIVGFTNTVIGLSNAYMDKMEYYRNAIEDADVSMDRLQNNLDPMTGVKYTRNDHAIQAGHYIKYEEALKKTSNFKEKSEIADAVNKAIESKATLNKWHNAMADYLLGIKNGTLTDEGYSQFPELRDSLGYHLSNHAKTWRIATGLASDAGETAELTLLKQSPLADFIIPMKSDAFLLKRLMNNFNVNEVSNTDALREEVANIRASVEKNKQTEGKNLSVIKSTESYDRYYASIEKTLSLLHETLNELNKESPNADVVEELINRLSNNYNGVFRNYNEFLENSPKHK